MNSLNYLRAALASAVLAGACTTAGTSSRSDEQEHVDDARDASSENGGAALDAGRTAALDSAFDGGRLSANSASPVIAAGSVLADAGLAAAGGARLPCDVQRIVSARCGLCHGAPPAFGASMPLTTQVEFHAPGTTDKTKPYFELAKARINASTNRMPPVGVAPLPANELATLNAWLERGAPASEERCASSSDGDAGVEPARAPGAIDTSGLECHRFVAHAPGDKSAKFAVGVAADAHFNMTFKSPWKGDAYAQVIRPLIDNTKVIHHWLLFAEEGGSDGAVEDDSLAVHTTGTVVAGWTPGGTSFDFREFGDVGLSLPSNSYVLELHYNSSDPSALDASGVEICLSKSKPEKVAGMSWLGHDNSIAAGDLDGPRASWTGVCKHQSKEPIHLLYVMPHMHKSGRHLKSIITSKDGATRVLHDLPFEFANQISYDKRGEALMPGESVTTTCTYDGPQTFGTTTAEEMCYLFVYSYPKGAIADNGLWGMLAHGEGTCLGQ